MDQKGQSTDSDSCVLEMDRLAHELEDKLATLNSSKVQVCDGHHPCSIIVGKVRDLTRNVDSSEYDPDHVATGPYNYPRLQSKNPHLAMEHLSKRGVIVHGHGNNEEVAKCFADLCKRIQFDPDDPSCNYVRETCKKLEKRFQSYPRRWIAWLMQRYFRNPWLTAGLLAAAIGLVLAVIQTVYSVLCYYKQ